MNWRPQCSHFWQKNYQMISFKWKYQVCSWDISHILGMYSSIYCLFEKFQKNSLWLGGPCSSRILKTSKRRVVERPSSSPCLSIYSRRWEDPQFYIQLVYKPHFGTRILLFGPFGQLRAVMKKKKIQYFFWLKIGYHSNFNPECKRGRGFINQLYIELGEEHAFFSSSCFLTCATLLRRYST